MLISTLFIKKYLPIFNAFIIFIFSLLAFFLIDYSISYFLIFYSLIILFSLVSFLLLLEKEIKKGWPLLSVFILFLASAIFFVVFIQSLTLKIFFIFIISVLAYIFSIAVFRFFYEPRKYSPYSMENISFSITLLTFTFVISDLFALNNFLEFPIWLCVILSFCISIITLLFIAWLNKIQLEKKFFIFISLMTGEFFWSLTLLPTSFYINGVISGLLFFIPINLIIKKNKDGLLTEDTLKKHLVLGIVVLFFIFLLAKWR
jgi:hypothetical protein